MIVRMSIFCFDDETKFTLFIVANKIAKNYKKNKNS